MSEIFEKVKNFIFARRHSYRVTFRGPHAETVLLDLSRFCRANDSCFHENERAHMLLEGRREVWLRIQKHLKLDDDQFWKTYGKKDLE